MGQDPRPSPSEPGDDSGIGYSIRVVSGNQTERAAAITTGATGLRLIEVIEGIGFRATYRRPSAMNLDATRSDGPSRPNTRSRKGSSRKGKRTRRLECSNLRVSYWCSGARLPPYFASSVRAGERPPNSGRQEKRKRPSVAGRSSRPSPSQKTSVRPRGRMRKPGVTGALGYQR